MIIVSYSPGITKVNCKHTKKHDNEAAAIIPYPADDSEHLIQLALAENTYTDRIAHHHKHFLIVVVPHLSYCSVLGSVPSSALCLFGRNTTKNECEFGCPAEEAAPCSGKYPGLSRWGREELCLRASACACEWACYSLLVHFRPTQGAEQ